MKKNRCFKLTALLLAMIMMISIFPSFALGATQSGGATPVDGVLVDCELTSTFVKSAKILDAKNKEVGDFSAVDPNGSFTLKLMVKEPDFPSSDEEKLSPDTKTIPMFYQMENMTAVSGENEVVSWEYDADDGVVYFYWKSGPQSSFEANIKVMPHYPAANDLSGSYVLGTARKSMLCTRTFKDVEKGRDKLYASEFTETDSKIHPATDENPIWVLEHVTGNYYTVRAQNTNNYIYISPKSQGKYLANSLYLVEGTQETAQKILVTDVGGGYYSFTYTYTDGNKYAINNSNNDKVGNSALRGFGCWTYAGYDNEKFKLYSPSALDNSATKDLSGTWVITNSSGKVTLTSKTSQTNRLDGMTYQLKNGATVAEDEVVTFTFEHVIRDWYTVSTESGYLNISKDGVKISSEPQRLLVKTDDNFGTVMLATGEYTNSTEKVYPTYALNFVGNKIFGSVLSKYSANTRMQLVSPSGFENGITVGFLSFDKNGGIATEVPQIIVGDAGEKVVLPDLSGTKNGQEFIGWADVKDFYSKVSGTNHSYHELYKAGSTYTLKNGTNTLYAVYNPTTRKVQFGIRKDGVIQDEPNNYPVDSYCGHFTVEGILKEGHWVVDIDSTKPVNGYYVQNDVIAALNWVPSAEEIAAALKKEGNIDFDPETQYIHYYVLKDTSATVWKIDGVIRNKARVGVSYNANVPGSEKTLVKSMPGGEQVVVGSNILVGTNVGSTEVLRPTREGYVFNGWNTEPDGTGTSYAEGHYVKLTSNLNLYAQWVKADEEDMVIYITSDWPAGKPAYAGTPITLTANLTGFEGKTYTLQWQYTIDQENWVDVPGANDINFTYAINAENAAYTWRVVANDVH